jgi:hypothetical protein
VLLLTALVARGYHFAVLDTLLLFSTASSTDPLSFLAI